MRKRILTVVSVLFAVVVLYAGGPSLRDTVPTYVSIMSYNIKMLPRGATYIKHHPVIRSRVLPEVLKEENSDVIVFQEAFDGKAMRIMRKRLKEDYPYIAGWKNRKVISYKRAGGVIMFSKYPMKELESIAYTKCKGIDCMANKGSLLVEVNHPKHKFQLLGTHMQAGGGKDIKESQYKEAGDLLKRHVQNGVPQFAAGDFNTHKNDPDLYPKLLKELDATDGDIDSELKYTSDHMLNDMDSYDPKRRNVIDYVFYKPNGVAARKCSRKVIAFEKPWSKKHKSLSDHNAIVLKMEW